MSDNEVLVNRSTYERMQKRLELLDWLEARGVDNWQNYSTPPDREDYETDEQYNEAYERALYGWP